MKVLLINIDSKIPNLALAKIEMWHKQQGDEVTWDFPLIRNQCDKVYVSCVFTKNRYLCNEYEGSAEIGGTGFDLYKKLPPEIEAMKPKLNWGFTSRGCPNKCSFCFVPRKEGKPYIVGDIYDIWDGKSKDLTIMDNNILSLPEHFKMICNQLRKEKVRVDFNQGLDIRLLTEESAMELKTIRHKEYHFSWDGKADLSERFKWLYSQLKRCTIYVLCGYDSTFEQDLKKCETLKEIGHNAFAMRYETVYHNADYIRLARWVNQHAMFHTKSFIEFTEMDNKTKLIEGSSCIRG